MLVVCGVQKFALNLGFRRDSPIAVNNLFFCIPHTTAHPNGDLSFADGN
jgi:hypothetical protein